MLQSGRIENFKEYSEFKSLRDFNNNIEMFLAVHKKDFTKTEFMLFRGLTKFCAKVPEVANASIRKILEGSKLKDFIYGASESTFQRMKRKAVSLDILEVNKITKDIAMLQGILNHSHPSITLRYIGIREEETNNVLKHFSVFY
jgi:hypothetical protein